MREEIIGEAGEEREPRNQVKVPATERRRELSSDTAGKYVD